MLWLDEESDALSEVVVGKSTKNIIKGRTGASQQFSNRELTAVPVTGARSIQLYLLSIMLTPR
jgi:hypothetical protein